MDESFFFFRKIKQKMPACNRKGFAHFKPAGGCIKRCPPGERHSTRPPHFPCYEPRLGKGRGLPFFTREAIRSMYAPAMAPPIIHLPRERVKMTKTPTQKQLDARAAGALRLAAFRKRVMAPKLAPSLKALYQSGSVGDFYKTAKFTYKKVKPGKVEKMKRVMRVM